MNTPITISPELVQRTLTQLQEMGRRNSESVLLWLASRRNDLVRIEKLWVPDQRVGSHFFEIPEESMEALFKELRNQRLFVAAQVHSHPHEAFHSLADDRWAIVRHSGALSLVVPYFALKTDLQSFIHDTALFVLSPKNEWTEVPSVDQPEFYQITP